MIITEIKKVRFNDECVDNPVFIAWLNSVGAWNHWLFSRTQIISFTSGGEVTFENPVDDLENAESFEEVISLIAGKGMILGRTNLDRNDIEFIKTIIFSTKVQVLANPDTWETEGPEWITVIPSRGRFPLIETGEPRADISLTITFPEIKTQTQ